MKATLAYIVICLSLHVCCNAVAAPEAPEKKLPIKGEVFTIEGRTAFLILPSKTALKKPIPWVWYAPTLPRLPGSAETWMFERFLARGIAIAGIDVGESYGSPRGRALYTALHRHLIEKRDFAPRACLLARSRGGLMLYNWAAENPDSVACIAGIYPVCNLRSYPGLDRACGAYGMTREQLEAKLTEHNPIDRLAPLARARVPIFHIHGDRDTVVPLEKNSGELEKRYSRLGGPMKLEVVKGQGHNMWPGWFQSQYLVDFVITHARENQPDANVQASSVLPKDLQKQFADPPLKYATRPLWFWNNTPVTEEGIVAQMQAARDLCGYGGFGILPFGKGFKPTYLTEEYFKMYGVALKQAKKLGMTMCIYDEYGFPSGSAGAIHGDGVRRFADKHPAHTIKRLDKHEQEVTGPVQFSATLPEGRLLSIVAMQMDLKKRVDLTGMIKDGKITWSVPAGPWKVMMFICVKDGDPNVDYLDPEAVELFVEMTHQQYYDRFKEYFGNTIDGTFHDEPTMYRAGGRIWTGKFNEKFVARYGFDPAPYYPALWYDIGPETSAARNYLFGFRTELYATSFPKVIQDWCDKHGITATGHQDQEEVINPVSVAGDLMKCFKHQDIPGVDKIGGNRPAERFYKVISSAAYNWDKALVMSETYGAMGDISWDTIYHVAMEQYTKGVNQLIPHAVWYDDGKVTFKPELSWRHKKYANGLRPYNTYMSRLNLLLQNHGRHVADIAVLYPIATMQAGHYLDGKLGHYRGGVAIPEADYVQVGELLATQLGRDYTFIHPEVLEEKCDINGDTLRLNNPINYEEYKVMIVPGHKTISWSSLKKVKAFHDSGGKVIATGTLPSRSAEFGHDEDVVKTIAALFSGSGQNRQGGKAVFLKKTTTKSLRDALDDMLDVYDVEFEVGKELRSIHKIVDGRHIYFLANLGKAPVSTRVELRGTLRPELWDPHTGAVSKPEYDHQKKGVADVTRVKLALPSIRSIFIVARQSP